MRVPQLSDSPIIASRESSPDLWGLESWDITATIEARKFAEKRRRGKLTVQKRKKGVLMGRD